MQKVNLEDLKIEITEVRLKRSDYEVKVVQFIKALLEIDQALKRQEDQSRSQSTASEMKEAS